MTKMSGRRSRRYGPHTRQRVLCDIRTEEAGLRSPCLTFPAIRTLGVALALLAGACTTFQPPRGPPLRVGTVTRIEQGSVPLSVAVRATPTSTSLQYCRASLVEGRITSVIADTVIFGGLSRLDAVTLGDAACRSSGAARLVLGSDWDARIGVERYDARRTIGVGLIVALAASMFITGI